MIKSVLFPPLIALLVSSSALGEEKLYTKDELETIASKEYELRKEILPNIITKMIEEGTRNQKELFEECFELYVPLFAGTVCSRFGGKELREKFEEECVETTKVILEEADK